MPELTKQRLCCDDATVSFHKSFLLTILFLFLTLESKIYWEKQSSTAGKNISKMGMGKVPRKKRKSSEPRTIISRCSGLLGCLDNCWTVVP